MLKKKNYKIKFKVNEENIIEPKFKLDEVVYFINSSDEIEKARIISITVTNFGQIIYSIRIDYSSYIIREVYEGSEKIHNTLEEAKKILFKKITEDIDRKYRV